MTKNVTTHRWTMLALAVLALLLSVGAYVIYIQTITLPLVRDVFSVQGVRTIGGGRIIVTFDDNLDASTVLSLARQFSASSECLGAKYFPTSINESIGNNTEQMFHGQFTNAVVVYARVEAAINASVQATVNTKSVDAVMLNDAMQRLSTRISQ